MKVLVADDEILARDELMYLLERHSDVLVVGEAANGPEVLEKVRQFEPEVVFLDVQMPEIDGLKTAKELLNLARPPYLVFATAFDCHAFEAFALEAVDYLLKPFSQERVDNTLNRLRKMLQKPQLTLDTLADALVNLRAQTSRSPKRIAVTDEEQTLFIDPEQIVYIFREEREVWICLNDGRYRCPHSLQEMEERLIDFPFFRPHRSYLVNLQHVSAIAPWFNGAYQLIMRDRAKSVVPVSRNQVKALHEELAL